MRNFLSIFIIFLFTNFTVSPAFFTSSFYGEVTEECADAGSTNQNNIEEEKEVKSFHPGEFAYQLMLSSKSVCFNARSGNLLSVFIETLIQPPRIFS